MTGTGSSRRDRVDADGDMGTPLRVLKERHGLTEAAIAEHLGVSQQAVSGWMRGKHRPSATNLARLAHLFEVSIQDLIPADASPDGEPVLLETGPPALPEPITAFIGRTDLVELIRRWVVRDRPRKRLIALVGPPGVGKSRLALRAAAPLEARFGPGNVGLVTIVREAAAREGARPPERVAAAIAAALSIRQQADRPWLSTLKSKLRGRPLVLVIDGFEWVIDEKPVLVELIASCPELTIIVTSRERLGVGEHEVRVPPLAVPQLPSRAQDPHLSVGERLAILEQARPHHRAWLATEAMQLFVDRAQRVHAGFTLTERTIAAAALICVWLEGMPLEIELAAARSRHFPDLSGLLAHEERRRRARGEATTSSRDGPPARRSAAAESYELLDRPLRVLFRRLAVFSGGFRLDDIVDYILSWEHDGEAPDAATMPRVGDGGAEEGVFALADASLVSVSAQPDGEPRYRMLDAVRDVGLGALRSSGEQRRAMRLHARWCHALAARGRRELLHQEQPAWALRVAAEIDNCRAALAWTKRHEPELGLALAAQLWRHWQFQGQFREGATWLRALLEAMPGADGIVAADAWRGLGSLEYYRGRLDEAWVAFERARAMFHQWDHPAGHAHAESGLGLVAQERGDFAGATRLFDAALERFESVGDEHARAFVLSNVGRLAYATASLEPAKRSLDEAIAIARRYGDQRLLADSLNTMARITVVEVEALRGQGNTAETEAAALASMADAMFREVRAICLAIGDRSGVAIADVNLAAVALEQGQVEAAARYLLDALEQFIDLDVRDLMVETLEAVAELCGVRRSLASESVRFFAACERLREEFGMPLSPTDISWRTSALARPRQALDAAQFEAAWQAGRADTDTDTLRRARALLTGIASEQLFVN